jgi:pyroglutamyl-peptidase
LSGPRRILVTGFEPFGGEAINASWEAARRLEGWNHGGWIAAARLLPCAYDVSVAEFIRAFERLRPEAVLMTGQAARRGIIHVERFARNLDHASAPENRGVRASGIAAAADAPQRLEATAPAAEIARAIREAGFNARVSTNAGGYVCNHLFYGALHHLSAEAPATLAIFLHLPATPGQNPPRASERRLSSSEAARALQAAAAALAGG